jgi:LuxR family maltose regulon positive regulatory protein
MQLGTRSGRLDAATNGAPTRVRLRLTHRDVGGALAALAEAEVALGAVHSPRSAAELLTLKAGILLSQGDVAEAAQCAQKADDLAGLDEGRVGELVAAAASRVLVAQGKPDEAVARLTRGVALAEATGRLGTALELRVVRSLAHASAGNTREAETDLSRALAQAESEGYVRVFLDEGESMAALLRRLSARPASAGDGGFSANFLASLLAAFDAPAERRVATSSPPPESFALSGTQLAGRAPTLVEPLSDRELEVLRLLAAGLTNEQIARSLTIALGTAKTHVHNLSAKLGAKNRVQAVARARALGLL